MNDLRFFVKESNRIEGITRAPTKREIEAHRDLLSMDRLTIVELELFVRAIGGGPLRQMEGMDVRIGTHTPPRGGQEIVTRLHDLIAEINNDARSPWENHCLYETLHPFMDGNGRSGRALWAWSILRFQHYPRGLHMGFLHPAYYAALEAYR